MDAVQAIPLPLIVLYFVISEISFCLNDSLIARCTNEDNLVFAEVFEVRRKLTPVNSDSTQPFKSKLD